jgi:hypothetical protein
MSDDPFADERDALDIDAMLEPTPPEDAGSSICAMLVGKEDSLKSGIAIDCRSKVQINDKKVVFVIDLDDANLPLWKDHWDCSAEIRVQNPAIMKSTKQDDGTEKLEIDYDRTIQRINQLVFKIVEAETSGAIELGGFVFDGVDKLLKSAENTMRTQKELDIDDGVSYQYWNIRNKLFTDVMFAVKHLKCPKYFITHLKTYQKKKTEGKKEIVVKEWEDGDWEKHTPNEMWQIIECRKEMGADGITDYYAKVREFKGRPELVGKELKTMTINSNEGTHTFWGLPMLRDKENVEEPDYDSELF